MNFEICTDSLDGVVAAEKHGAHRVELCAALAVGGLSPSVALIRQCVERTGIEIHAMVRPKEGGFIYESSQIDQMKEEIEAVSEAGAHGVVFGILTAKGAIAPENKTLCSLAHSLGLKATFHRAFDLVSDPVTAIEQVIDYRFDRLLTSGLQATAPEGLELLGKLQTAYGSQIQLMAGSGIHAGNARDISACGIEHLHFTARKVQGNPLAFSMGSNTVVDEAKIRAIISLY